MEMCSTNGDDVAQNTKGNITGIGNIYIRSKCIKERRQRVLVKMKELEAVTKKV